AHTQGTRPEGLGGSRDAGSATADPRPPYVTEAEAVTATARLRRTAATAVRAVRAVRGKERRFLYCFFFPFRMLFSTRFFRLLFSSSGFLSFSSLPLFPTAGPTAYSDDRIRLEKHAFFYRKVGYSPGPGPGPGPDKSIEHSYRGGYSYGTATLYSGYGRTGRTGYTGEGT
ncbi:hypothetical protein L249_5388, partial [Ophiocordyceps polyrhachis-furcata BCC 54312]